MFPHWPRWEVVERLPGVKVLRCTRTKIRLVDGQESPVTTDTAPVEAAERVMCANEDHARPTPAVALMTWPDGRFRPTTGCVGDMTRIIRDSLHEGHTVLVEPAIENTTGPYLSYTVTHQVTELVRVHRRERGREVRAILLEAPDMPGYDELPETLEERQKLPARFHIPAWDGDGQPNAWLCQVCWDEDTVTSWPCATAAKNGGEVFAR